MLENWQRAGFGLYIHWPFCEAKCPYCDFNSHVVRSIDHDAWCDAYLKEVDRWADRIGPRTVTSVFFGGGTPSLMQPGTVERVLSRIAERFSLSNTVEITLEANPSSVESGKFIGFSKAGINRVSLGVQALNDPDLKALGRLHGADEALFALDIAQRNFERVSFDLIYARQNQSLADWESELDQALSLGIRHLSLYQLTIEDGTAFGDRFALGKLKGLPDEDLGADLFSLTQERCAAAGLHGYEISNHAATGQESRHNLIYWRGGDYLGIGPGAHGRVTRDGIRSATIAASHPGLWLQQARSGPAWQEEVLSPSEIATERLLMGLRLSESLDLQALHEETGFRIDSQRLTNLEDRGLVSTDGQYLGVTNRGRPILNAILQDLLAA